MTHSTALSTLVLIILPGCVVPLAAPPLRGDVAAATAVSRDGANTGIRAAVGVSWASAATGRPHRYDATAGYVYERLGLPPKDGDVLDLDAAGARSLHGGFVEYGQVLSSSYAQRTWISGRGELLYDTGPARGLAWGASARATWELFTAGRDSAPVSARCAIGTSFRFGTTAVGLYVEGGYRRLPDQGPAFVATAGVSVRLPTMAVVALVLPLPGCFSS